MPRKYDPVKNRAMNRRAYARVVADPVRWARRKRKSFLNHRRSYLVTKTYVFNLYGNVCCICGETDPGTFQLDHVHGDGADERRRKSSVQTYREIERAGRRRDDLRLVCASCNVRLRPDIYGPDVSKWPSDPRRQRMFEDKDPSQHGMSDAETRAYISLLESGDIVTELDVHGRPRTMSGAVARQDWVTETVVKLTAATNGVLTADIGGVQVGAQLGSALIIFLKANQGFLLRLGQDNFADLLYLLHANKQEEAFQLLSSKMDADEIIAKIEADAQALQQLNDEHDKFVA